MSRLDYTEVADKPIKVRAWLNAVAVYQTPITGHSAKIDRPGSECELHPDGLLEVRSMFLTDFGTRAPRNDAIMREASVAHDALCRLWTHGKLPWAARFKADQFFRQLLREEGASGWRQWTRWGAVTLGTLTGGVWDRLTHRT